MKTLFFIGAALVLMCTAAQGAVSKNYCGPIANHYGPYDYRKRGQVNLEIVEEGHFTPEVENGIKGSTGTIGADLCYTLRAIPNHHRALATMGRVGIRDKTTHVPNARYPVECYFERATRFAPDDGIARAAYGNYLFALGKFDRALTIFQEAVLLAPKDATVNYNIGLLYAKQKQYDKAVLHAKKAYALGFPLLGLKKRLIEAGKWSAQDDAAAEVKKDEPAPVAPNERPSAVVDATPAPAPAAASAPTPAQTPGKGL